MRRKTKNNRCSDRKNIPYLRRVKVRDKLIASFGDLDSEIGGYMIKSENFQALNLLKEKFQGKIKCIYIDPPYNTGNNEFIYKDNYQHSSWLSMMQERLAISRDFLSNDGVIFVSIDDNEESNLRYLFNVIFGSGNFVIPLYGKKDTHETTVR